MKSLKDILCSLEGLSDIELFVIDLFCGAGGLSQAREYVEKHCGLLLGGDIHTTLPDKIITDWIFNVHPKKIIR